MKLQLKTVATALGIMSTAVTAPTAQAQTCDPAPCRQIADVNGDGVHDVLDVVGIVSIAFRNGVPRFPFRV